MQIKTPLPLTAAQVLDREFLEMRAKVLELAASLDRLERAEGSVDGDSRLVRLHHALECLLDGGNSDRAERIQLLFSRGYEPDWRSSFGLKEH